MKLADTVRLVADHRISIKILRGNLSSKKRIELADVLQKTQEKYKSFPRSTKGLKTEV